MTVKNDAGMLKDRYLTWSEAEFEDAIIDYAHACGWLVAHFRPAQIRPGKWVTPMKGDTGFPDLVLARCGVVHHWELKRAGNGPTGYQVNWIQALNGRVLHPADWPEVKEALA